MTNRNAKKPLCANSRSCSPKHNGKRNFARPTPKWLPNNFLSDNSLNKSEDSASIASTPLSCPDQSKTTSWTVFSLAKKNPLCVDWAKNKALRRNKEKECLPTWTSYGRRTSLADYSCDHSQKKSAIEPMWAVATTRSCWRPSSSVDSGGHSQTSPKAATSYGHNLRLIVSSKHSSLPPTSVTPLFPPVLTANRAIGTNCMGEYSTETTYRIGSSTWVGTARTK